MKRCPATGKRKYQTKVGAMLANADRPVIARAYWCHFCDSWHITSKPKRHVDRSAGGEAHNT